MKVATFIFFSFKHGMIEMVIIMKKILIVFSLTLLAISCDDILDISPKDRISDDAIWTDENLIKAYHTDL